ncbi:hypothetical protein ACT43R_18050 [Acinetobacter baumannii]|uniref:hypothetical protein n=1 Tax=Acinetobacter baumannii TaxID=470 RepID=UPI00233F0555|nr:hypothetical protein [Acinetobacter baumannii]MDC4801141.1 hypothetical protein [Acinetobacter baumannii]MDC5521217.1 hypothetical protein [Acinetobacter baumannii]MDC5526070.1 hypothetical protein [Acinetobacter baumannii]MDC5540596.1 hypothetical protein [Acinetobacter baumannii]MDH2627338.1 hypothetical protein [Acinetobacter baumannii]
MNNFQFSDDQIDYILNCQEAKYHHLGWLWDAMDSLERNKGLSVSLINNFDLKKEFFFNLLRKLISENKLKLARNNKIRDGEITEILSDFSLIFPISAESCEHLGGVHVWFMLNSEEYWPVWIDIDEDGNEKLWWAE